MLEQCSNQAFQMFASKKIQGSLRFLPDHIVKLFLLRKLHRGSIQKKRILNWICLPGRSTRFLLYSISESCIGLVGNIPGKRINRIVTKGIVKSEWRQAQIGPTIVHQNFK